MFGLREMYCQSFADKLWLVNVDRRKKEELSQSITKERDSVDQAKLFIKVAIPDDMEGVEQEGGRAGTNGHRLYDGG